MLLVKLIVLLVKVWIEAIPATVSFPAKNVAVPEATAGATTVVVPEVEPAKVKPPDPIAGVVKDGDAARTTAPDPVVAEIVVLLIFKVLPAVPVSNVFPVKLVPIPTCQVLMKKKSLV